MLIPGGKQTAQLELSVGCDACGIKLASIKLVVESADPEQLQDITRSVRPSEYSLHATCQKCQVDMNQAGEAAYKAHSSNDATERYRAQRAASEARKLEIQIAHGLAERPVEEAETVEEPVAV